MCDILGCGVEEDYVDGLCYRCYMQRISDETEEESDLDELLEATIESLQKLVGKIVSVELHDEQQVSGLGNIQFMDIVPKEGGAELIFGKENPRSVLLEHVSVMKWKEDGLSYQYCVPSRLLVDDEEYDD